MPYNNNDTVGSDGEWFTSIYIDVANTSDTIHLAGVEEGLHIYVDSSIPLTQKNVHELRLALSRYESWLKATDRP